MSLNSKAKQATINQEIKSLIADKGVDVKAYTTEDLTLLAQLEGAGGVESRGAAILDQYFTPDYIVKQMYALAYKHGFPTNGKVLEPAAGSGRFIAHAPVQANVTAFEIDPAAYAVAKLLYPKATVYNQFFETAFLQPPRFATAIKNGKPTWLTDAPFDLVIGNPPYGKHGNEYSSYFKSPNLPNIETFFMYHGLRLLKPKGLLIYITSSNFLRNGHTYNDAKKSILSIADMVDAYRMPNGLFAYTEVGTDIIIFQKK